MRIAILGWGSLLWDKQEKHHWFYETICEWQPAGPTLPLEFCRISSSRKQALTLVLQSPPIGSQCRVSYALSKRVELAGAIADLVKREGCYEAAVGLCMAGDAAKGKGQFPEMVAVIQKWLDATEPKIDAVIWTNLENNFEAESDRKKPFSITEALIHLKGLSTEGRSKAAEYVWRAPDFIQTKLRKKLETWPCSVPARQKAKGAAKRPRSKAKKRTRKG